MAVKNIVIFGGSFNPPGIHHYQLAIELSQYFDAVIVVPCGSARNDKATITCVDSRHRIAMAKLTFGNLEKVELDLFDVIKNGFTPHCQLAERFKQQYENCKIWFQVGADQFVLGSDGVLPIKKWKKAGFIWKNLNFAITARGKYNLDEKNLPSARQRKLIELDIPGSSSAIREAIVLGESFEQMVRPEVGKYIKENFLYGFYPP